MAARALRSGLSERFACGRSIRGVPAGSDAGLVLEAGDRCNLHRAGDEPAQVASTTGGVCPAVFFDRGCRVPWSHCALPADSLRLLCRLDGPGVRIDCGAACRNRTLRVFGFLRLCVCGFQVSTSTCYPKKKYAYQAFGRCIRAYGAQCRNPDVGSRGAASAPTMHTSSQLTARRFPEYSGYAERSGPANGN
jgi:hypothetical protein